MHLPGAHADTDLAQYAAQEEVGPISGASRSPARPAGLALPSSSPNVLAGVTVNRATSFSPGPMRRCDVLKYSCCDSCDVCTLYPMSEMKREGRGGV